MRSTIASLAAVSYNIVNPLWRQLPWGVRNAISQHVRHIHKADREYMESVILPGVASLNPQQVLFIGVEHYTRHYPKWFPPPAIYWTLDIRLEAREWGSDHHVTADVRLADRHLKPESFDAVFLNGVIGWGLDGIDEQNQALRAIRSLMKMGAGLILGWNTDRSEDPLRLEAAVSFTPQAIWEGCPPRKTFSDCTHVYDFLVAR